MRTPPIPPRPADGHKGTFGTVLVVGGCCGERVMLGGPVLAGLAALRAGAGLCELALPESLLSAALGAAPTATGVPLRELGGRLDAESAIASLAAALERATVVAVGPGWGGGGEVEELLGAILERARSLGKALVLDADGINALARRGGTARLPKDAVLTPHPGEFRRLADACGLASLDPISPGARTEAARTMSRALGAVVVLKGHRTVVADGDRVEIDEVGGSILATGGSGDVLTGVVAGLWSQWIAGGADAGARRFEAACGAVLVHATAGVRWEQAHGDRGLLATDLLSEIPGALGEVRAATR